MWKVNGPAQLQLVDVVLSTWVADEIFGYVSGNHTIVDNVIDPLICDIMLHWLDFWGGMNKE